MSLSSQDLHKIKELISARLLCTEELMYEMTKAMLSVQEEYIKNIKTKETPHAKSTRI